MPIRCVTEMHKDQKSRDLDELGWNDFPFFPGASSEMFSVCNQSNESLLALKWHLCAQKNLADWNHLRAKKK